MRTLTLTFCLLSTLLIAGISFSTPVAAQQPPKAKGDTKLTKAGKLHKSVDQSFSELKSATWRLTDAAGEAKAEANKTKKQRLVDKARKNLKVAKDALVNFEKAIQKMKDDKPEKGAKPKNPRWETTVKYLESRRDYYRKEIEKAEEKLPKEAGPVAGSPSQPGEPTAPAQPVADGSAPGADRGDTPRNNPADSGTSPSRETPATVMLPDGTLQPYHSRSNFRMRVELQEMHDRLELWQQFRNQEYAGWGILYNVRDAFVKHGAPADSGNIQPWSQNIDIGGSMTMFGDWDALRRAIEDFQNQLSLHERVEGQEAYLNYLKRAMVVWRQDIVLKNQRAQMLVDLIGQLGAEAEKEKQPRWAELERKIKQTKAEVNRKAPIDVKLYDKWMKTPEDLENFIENAIKPMAKGELSLDELSALLYADQLQKEFRDATKE